MGYSIQGDRAGLRDHRNLKRSEPEPRIGKRRRPWRRWIAQAGEGVDGHESSFQGHAGEPTVLPELSQLRVSLMLAADITHDGRQERLPDPTVRGLLPSTPSAQSHLSPAVVQQVSSSPPILWASWPAGRASTDVTP